MTTIGIDEAGRGPILGPLVLAAVSLTPRRAAGLTRAGVLDSKSFGAGPEAHARRSTLVAKILGAAEASALAVVDVAEVDRFVKDGALNRLEQRHAERLLHRLPTSDQIVADGKNLFGPLRARWPGLRAVDHGEEAHVSVAAASILAKVRRDEIWMRIEARYRADFGAIEGMGYVNAATYRFLRAYIERRRALPPEARRSWPWGFARDLLPPEFDPRSEIPNDQLLLGI
jgi:ribonuclease HII